MNSDENRKRLIDSLTARRKAYARKLPNLKETGDFAEQILSVLFPHFGTSTSTDSAQVESELRHLEETLTGLLSQDVLKCSRPSKQIGADFMNSLPDISERLLEDAEAILKGDPAAGSTDEVILAYPGFLAIGVYRIANQFYRQGVPLLPRLFTEFAHQRTGIDIHPGATIGRHFFIDHGTGIVIGETTHIHDHVKVYQGVTLGALSVEKELANKKRHPTIEERVVIYSNATILGGETVIGHDSVIGGNVWITASVPPQSVIYHKSDIKIKNSKTE